MSRQKGLSFIQKKKVITASLMKRIFNVIFITFIAALMAFVIVFFWGMKTSVIGPAMEPTLYNSQTVYVNRFVYRFVSPNRGDVIVFLPNGNPNSHYYIKRVIGLPGDTVQIINGFVYINGIPLDEDDRYDKIVDSGIAVNEIVLGDNEYFVLGDNRNSSEDSRSANFGAVKKEYIIGKAWFHSGCKEDGIGFVE